MDGISAASSILTIGAAGVSISIKLIAFANQVSTASSRIQSIGSDVSLTANVLQQLGDLMSKREDDKAVSVFSEDGLSTTKASADACRTVFYKLEEVLRKASQQLRANGNKAAIGKKVTLSKYEALKWPFLQPSIDTLRTTMKDARDTLMLILHITTLAYLKKQAEIYKPSELSRDEQSQLVSAILAMQSQNTAAKPVKASKAMEKRDTPEPLPEDRENDEESNIHDNAFRTIGNGSIVIQPSAPLSRASSRDLVDPLDPSNTVIADDRSLGSGNLIKRVPNLKSLPAASQSLGTLTSVEALMVTPEIYPVDNSLDSLGYDLRWEGTKMPLETLELERPRRLRWRKKKDDIDKFARLTQMERKVVKRYLSHDKPDLGCDHSTIIDVHFKKMQPSREPNTQMPWRCVLVLISRKKRILHFTGGLSYQEPIPSFSSERILHHKLNDVRRKPRRMSHKLHQDSYSRPTAVAHQQLLGVETNSELWEEEIIEGARKGHEKNKADDVKVESIEEFDGDNSEAGQKRLEDPNCMRDYPPPRSTRAMLGKESKKSLRSKYDDSVGDRPGKTMDVIQPTYITKVHRKHLSPDTLDLYGLPWEWDDRDSNYIVIKRWISERYQDILSESTKRLREKRSLENSTFEPKKKRNNSLMEISESPSRQRPQLPQHSVSGGENPQRQRISKANIPIRDTNTTGNFILDGESIARAAVFSKAAEKKVESIELLEESLDLTAKEENQAAAEAEREKASAAASQKIIDDLLAKYTTIHD